MVKNWITRKVAGDPSPASADAVKNIGAFPRHFIPAGVFNAGKETLFASAGECRPRDEFPPHPGAEPERTVYGALSDGTRQTVDNPSPFTLRVPMSMEWIPALSPWNSLQEKPPIPFSLAFPGKWRDFSPFRRERRWRRRGSPLSSETMRRRMPSRNGVFAARGWFFRDRHGQPEGGGVLVGGDALRGRILRGACPDRCSPRGDPCAPCGFARDVCLGAADLRSLSEEVRRNDGARGTEERENASEEERLEEEFVDDESGVP